MGHAVEHDEGHTRALLAELLAKLLGDLGRARLICVEQLDQVGGRCRRSDADELQVGRMACGELAGIKRRMSALALAPPKAVRGACVGEIARGADPRTARPSLSPIR